MTKMTDAFKKLFLGLGGNPSELAENNDVGDYIEDLEEAIKSYVTEAATAELPTPSSDNNGKVATVVSDGEGGYRWDADDISGGVPEIKPSELVNNPKRVLAHYNDDVRWTGLYALYSIGLMSSYDGTTWSFTPYSVTRQDLCKYAQRDQSYTISFSLSSWTDNKYINASELRCMGASFSDERPNLSYAIFFGVGYDSTSKKCYDICVKIGSSSEYDEVYYSEKTMTKVYPAT